MKKKKISIIATFRNEEKNISLFAKRIKKSFKKIKKINYEILFIDDNSNDQSNAIIKKERKRNKKIKLITLNKRYGHNASVQTGFDIINKNNFATVIDCDLQDRPELIANNFSKIKPKETIHFVRTKRDDPIFQRFYTWIAYLILYFISGGKIISNCNYFKIIPPEVVIKIKKNLEIDPYWHYLFTKFSNINKVVFYVRKKRMHGRSKFNLFSLNPWLTFFTAVNYFKQRFIFIVLILLLITFLILAVVIQNYYNTLLIIFLILLIFFLSVNLLIAFLMNSRKKKHKRIYCRYK